MNREKFIKIIEFYGFHKASKNAWINVNIDDIKEDKFTIKSDDKIKRTIIYDNSQKKPSIEIFSSYYDAYMDLFNSY